ncbi:MAG: GNAT family N-acetyltransferase [Prevotellaceae bacterium]|jgi:ribosomal protein S18 acetylase RimI-like enzyme|nr:GNAT family N-acetyltransferase [Prevotellaceae bacterium]
MNDIVVCDYSNQAHLKAVISLINANINDEMGGGTPLSSEKQQQMVDGLANHPKAIVLLAQDTDNFVGVLVAFENYSTFTAQPMINIHDIFVLKKYRGNGIGRRLMNRIVDEAEKRKCSRLTLEVRKDNVKAQNLYQSLGFEEVNPKMFYWRKPLEYTNEKD